MTADEHLARALDKLTDSVNDHKLVLATKMATLGTKVEALSESHAANAEKLDEVLRLELSCPARAGWDGLGREMGEAKKKISDNRIDVEAELRILRGDATGQTDVAGGRRVSDMGGGKNLLRGLLWKAIPYIIFGILGLGFLWGSNGDVVAMTNALRAVSDAVQQIDRKVEKLEEVPVSDMEVGSPLLLGAGTASTMSGVGEEP